MRSGLSAAGLQAWCKEQERQWDLVADDESEQTQHRCAARGRAIAFEAVARRIEEYDKAERSEAF